jgi:signal peptidase II
LFEAKGYTLRMILGVTIVLSALVSLIASLLADYLTVRIPLLGSFAGLQLAHNPGIAFSIPLPKGFELIIILIALGLITLLAVRSAKFTIQHIGYGLIIGGALGNILDRLPDGFVTDYFQVGTFPIFNVADSCITIGVTVLICEEIWRFWKKR